MYAIEVYEIEVYIIEVYEIEIKGYERNQGCPIWSPSSIAQVCCHCDPSYPSMFELELHQSVKVYEIEVYEIQVH